MCYTKVLQYEIPTQTIITCCRCCSSSVHVTLFIIASEIHNFSLFCFIERKNEDVAVTLYKNIPFHHLLEPLHCPCIPPTISYSIHLSNIENTHLYF